MSKKSPFDRLVLRARDGDPEAQFTLGKLYRSQGGEAIDEVAEWFMKAADQNHAPAQVALALLYLEWLPDEDYREQAQYWLERAVQNGCEDAVKVLVEFGPSDEDMDGSDLLVEADEGNPQAQYKLGCRLFWGSGLRKSPSEGLSLIQKAAVAGHTKAQVRIATEYLFGTHMDKSEAFKWLWLSAQQKNREAYFYLGVCYEEGWGVTRNEEQAAACFLKSAQMGDSDAQYRLAGFYREGIGLPANQEQEEAWCREAALQGHDEAREMLRYLQEVWEGEKE